MSFIGNYDGQEDEDRDYKVGYGRPPKHARFGRGRSGNPKGRPLGVKNALTIMKRELLAPALVKQHGRQGKTTKFRTIAVQLVNKAVRGDYGAIRLLFKYGKLDHVLNEPTRRPSGPPPELIDMFREAVTGKPRAQTNPGGPDSHVCVTNQKLESQTSEQPQEGYAIGYRRPPVSARFKKGQSGNPAGRPLVPKGLRATIFTLLEEHITVTENGRTRRCTKLELIFTQIVNQAASGDLRFQRLVFDYAAALDLELTDKERLPKNFVEHIRKSLYDSVIKGRREY